MGGNMRKKTKKAGLGIKIYSVLIILAVLILGYEYYKTTIDVNGSRFITNGGEIASKEKIFKLHYLFYLTLDPKCVKIIM